jgi:hypothetical protein
MKVQLVTLYRVTHLQRYEVTLRGNVASLYPPLDRAAEAQISFSAPCSRALSACVFC